jgi:DNA polymerase bacteriophage-type
VLAWLAGERDLLQTFATGGDVYKVMAGKIYSKPAAAIEKSERQMGKMAILGLGYGMGAKKFVDACKTMAQIEVTAEESKQVVDLYRSSNTAIVALWKELEAAALKACREPGTRQLAANGRVRFMRRDGYLWMRLPSGRRLCYSSPQVVERVTPWGSTAQAVRVWGVNSYTRKWEPYDLYSGLLAENAVQAIARDVLVEAMLRAEKNSYPCILSVHDEIVTEVKAGAGSPKELEEIMNIKPAWAEDLPLASEGWENFRYKK